jgi:hypothetical protein
MITLEPAQISTFPMRCAGTSFLNRLPGTPTPAGDKSGYFHRVPQLRVVLGVDNSLMLQLSYSTRVDTVSIRNPIGNPDICLPSLCATV